MKIITRFLKGITFLIVGFVCPIPAFVEPDGTKFKCTFKGVKNLNTNSIENWQDLKKDFFEWCRA